HGHGDGHARGAPPARAPARRGGVRMDPPRFYDPAAVGTLYLERAALVAEEATAYRAAHGVADAREDKERIAAFGIDCQVAFCIPGASLFVPGAVEDSVRAIEWLYRNLSRITTLVFS